MVSFYDKSISPNPLKRLLHEFLKWYCYRRWLWNSLKMNSFSVVFSRIFHRHSTDYLQNSHFQEQLIWQNAFSRRSLIWENLFEEVCKIIFLSQWQKFMNYHEISFLTILRSYYVRFNINLALLDKSS